MQLMHILVGIFMVDFGSGLPHNSRQCQPVLDVALAVATRLQSHYFTPTTGQYNEGSLWTDANTLEDLHNFMLVAESDEFSSLADESYIGKAALNKDTNWQDFLGGSNDDAQWIILALWKIADYKVARGQTNSGAYLNSADKIYNIISQQWDDAVCGGGVWWSTAHTYKNAITNMQFLLTSSSGYIRTNNTLYLDNANKEWTWLKNSGMQNAKGLWNDGLNSECQNNGQTTWTYNQGVIASGLGALYSITGDEQLLEAAETTLDATIDNLAVNKVLKESCDDASNPDVGCNHDQQIFKGIWTKHLQYFLDRDSSRIAKYSGFLASQQSAVVHFGKNAQDDIGSVWYAADNGGSIFSPEASASGLAALIAAAKYGSC